MGNKGKTRSREIGHLIKAFKLKRHPEEGGYFAETYRSPEKVDGRALPGRYGGGRRFSTAIYYLYTRESISFMHRIKSDEIYHFYLGDPLEMLQLGPAGKGRKIVLGSNILKGMRLQAVVPRGIWQGARLKPGGKFALVGTTVAPGFEYEDYEHGKRDILIKRYPRFRKMVEILTQEEVRIQESEFRIKPLEGKYERK